MGKVACVTCEKEFHVPAYREKTARYCSRVCMGKAYSEKGAFHVPEAKRQSHVCGHCGQQFERQEAREKHGRAKYCSRDCQYAAARQKPKKVVSFTCQGCGADFERYPSQLRQKKGAGKYCSRKCRDETRVGGNHPQFITGESNLKYGSNWQAQKRKVKRRDKWTCQQCGLGHQECVAQYGQGLHVHHIKPFRLFQSFLEANVLSNLETRCPPCHREADAAIQAAERALAEST